MIKAIVSDFSRVLLFPKDKSYQGSLNSLHKELSADPAYNPLEHFEFNQNLLNLYASLKKYPIYMFTSDSIQEAKEFQEVLKPIFKGILSAKKLNTEKKLPQAYKLVAEEIGLTPEEILFVDDLEENIQAAKEAGCKTLLYRDFETLHNKITEALES